MPICCPERTRLSGHQPTLATITSWRSTTTAQEAPTPMSHATALPLVGTVTVIESSRRSERNGVCFLATTISPFVWGKLGFKHNNQKSFLQNRWRMEIQSILKLIMFSLVVIFTTLPPLPIATPMLPNTKTTLTSIYLRMLCLSCLY